MRQTSSILLTFAVLASGFVNAQTGQLQTCNGCSIPLMRQVAVASGAGEHLIIDVAGRKGRIYTVACGPDLDHPDPKSDPKDAKPSDDSESSEICGVNGTRWTSEDQEAFGFIIDGMTANGSWQKDIVISKPYDSLYEIAANPAYGFTPIENSLWHNLLTYHPGTAVWATLTTWGQQFGGFVSDATILIKLEFPDGHVFAEIDMSWVAQGWSEPTEAHVTILYDTAIDLDGNLIPNVSGPAQIGPPGATFSFFGSGAEPGGWRNLMENLGYGFTSGASGSVWRCGLASGNGTSGYTCVLLIP